MIAKVYRLLGPLLAGMLFIWLMPLVVRADGGAPNLAYVAGSSQGVSIIDVGQQKVTGHISIKGDLHMILLSMDARFLYVTQPQFDKVAIIAAKTGDTICTANIAGQPSLLAIEKNSSIVYIAGNGASSVSAMDPTNCTIKYTYRVAGPVYGLAIAEVGTSDSGHGNQLWVSASNQLQIFDLNSNKEIASIPIAGGPGYISIPFGTTAYITTRQGSLMAVSIGEPYQTVMLTSGGKYGPMDFDESTGEVYVPDLLHNELAVITPVNIGSTVPHEPNRTIKLSAPPQSVAITSDGQLGFVALQDGHVVMLDVPGRQTITTYDVGGSPRFIITGLYPPALGTTPQQADILGTIASVAAYLFVIALLVVPVILFRRYSKARVAVEAGQEQREDSRLPH